MAMERGREVRRHQREFGLEELDEALVFSVAGCGEVVGSDGREQEAFPPVAGCEMLAVEEEDYLRGYG